MKRAGRKARHKSWRNRNWSLVWLARRWQRSTTLIWVSRSSVSWASISAGILHLALLCWMWIRCLMIHRWHRAQKKEGVGPETPLHRRRCVHSESRLKRHEVLKETTQRAVSQAKLIMTTSTLRWGSSTIIQMTKSNRSRLNLEQNYRKRRSAPANRCLKTCQSLGCKVSIASSTSRRTRVPEGAAFGNSRSKLSTSTPPKVKRPGQTTTMSTSQPMPWTCQVHKPRHASTLPIQRTPVHPTNKKITKQPSKIRCRQHLQPKATTENPRHLRTSATTSLAKCVNCNQLAFKNVEDYRALPETILDWRQEVWRRTYIIIVSNRSKTCRSKPPSLTKTNEGALQTCRGLTTGRTAPHPCQITNDFNC